MPVEKHTHVMIIYVHRICGSVAYIMRVSGDLHNRYLRDYQRFHKIIDFRQNSEVYPLHSAIFYHKLFVVKTHSYSILYSFDKV